MKKASLPIPVRIKKIIKENFKTKTYICDHNTKARPGQFIMVWLANLAEKPFSLTNNSPMTFTVMSVGKFTKRINNDLKVGDTIWYRGPFGNGVFHEEKGPKILIGGGCGIVPIYFLAKTLNNRKNATVIIGVKTKKELILIKRIKKLGCKIVIYTDDGSTGKRGHPTDLLKKMCQQKKIFTMYACGPEIMLKKIALFCKKNNIKCQLSLEALMKCGFGICGSCAIGDKLVCKDGPVFSRWPKKL